MEQGLIYLVGYALYFMVLVVLIMAWDFLVTQVARRRRHRWEWHRAPSCQYLGADVWLVAIAFFVFSVSASELTSVILTLVL